VAPHEVDDCFQETFLAALRSYPRVTPNSHLRAWVLRIAERKAVDAHRARARRPTPTDDIAAEPVGGDDSFDPQLWKAVRGLPRKQRAAIALRFIGDLPYAEVARAIGGSEDAARQNVRAGLRKLREVWR
jgi:RNA polymerase sigma factor (sigma-70 family)